METKHKCKMIGKGFCPKPLEYTADFLGKKWTLSILVTIGNFKTIRFNELKNRLSTVSQKTLTDRLRELQKLGLISRTAYPEIPPRVEYSLTKEGKNLWKHLLPITKWASKQPKAH